MRIARGPLDATSGALLSRNSDSIPTFLSGAKGRNQPRRGSYQLRGRCHSDPERSEGEEPGGVGGASLRIRVPRPPRSLATLGMKFAAIAAPQSTHRFARSSDSDSLAECDFVLWCLSYCLLILRWRDI